MKTGFKVFNYIAIFILVFGFISQKPAFAADGDPVCIVETATCYTTIQAAIDAASAGNHITVVPDTYVEYLDIPKSITITGTGADPSEVTIDTRGSADYGIHAYGDITTSFSNFTVIGPTSPTSGYGLKIAGDNAQTTIQNVAVQNSARSGIDLNGLSGGSVDNVTLTGNGIVGLALTNCSNIAVSNITTSGNGIAGMALYTDSTSYTQGSSGVSLTGTNSFGEQSKLYFEIDPLFPITGFTQTTFLYTVKNSVSLPNMTGFALTLEDAVAGALAIPNPATSSVEKWSDGSQIVVPGMSIQAAINAATPGDTIYVSPGNYSENLTINKSLSLIGDLTVDMVGVETPDFPADYNITGPAGNHVITITAGNVTVSGFNIYNSHGTTDSLAAIAVQGAISNVDITDNFIESDDLGVAIAYASGVTLEDNEIVGSNIAVYLLASGNLINHNNISGGANSGIYGDEDTTNNTVTGNFIIGNSGDGVYLWKASTYTISNNVIGANGNHGIHLFGSHNNTISGNTIEDNTATGIRIRLSGTDASSPNAINLNQFNNPAYNLFVETGIGTIDAARNWWGSEEQPEFIGKILGPVSYVPWCTDEVCSTFGYPPVHNVTQNTYFTMIQAAIDAANSNDIIEVSSGTYVESLDIIGKNITLRAPSGATIESPVDIATDFTTSEANSAVVYLNNTTSIIDGFTIDGASHGNVNYRFYGVAFYNAGGTIQNTTVKNIQENPFNGNQHGNAIYAYNDDSTARTINLTGNTVYDFQKNGITMNGELLAANVDNNTVTCKGTTSVTAQNGIQIGYGADATLAGNTVSGCSFHLEGSDWDWAATGILLNEPGTVTLEGGNTMTGNSQNLYIYNPTGAIIVGAETFGSLTGPLESSYHVINFSDSDINLSTSTFDGVPLADATTAQLLSFAGLVYDGIDDDTLGVALLRSGYQFVDPEGTIQAAIDKATPGDIILVAAGTYTENIRIYKSLTLAGSGALTTTILPAVSLPNPCTGSSLCGSPTAASNVILVEANNVIIHDIGVNGDNPALTSGIVREGADIDARNGIIKNTDGYYNNLEVYNTLVQNIYLRGIYSTDGSFNFHNNTVTNVKGDDYSIAIFAWGGPGIIDSNTVSYANDAISANHSRGIQFLNNTVTYSGSGIHTDNSNDGGGVADLIQNNSINCTGVTNAYGIWSFVPYVAPVINNNTITNCAVGLSAWGQGAPVTAQFTNNTVDGGGLAGSTGVYITTDLIGWGYTDVSVLFTGNTIKNNQWGIELNAAQQSWNTEPYTPQTITADFNYSQIVDNTNGLIQTAGGGTINTTATPNWWGLTTGPTPGMVAIGVPYIPWCTNAACTAFDAPVTNITRNTYFATIQAAINDPLTVDGDEINIEAGIFDEQVVLTKGVTLTGAGDTTIIRPSQTTADAFAVFDRKTGGALNTTGVVVTNTTSPITLNDLKIDGSLVTSTPTGATFMGLLDRGTPASINGVTVTGLSLSNGNGMYLAGYGPDVTVTVSGCDISTYEKNGITANNAGMTANISGCTITGSGPTTGTAQNGIQIGWGATGTLSGNTISGNAWTGTYGGTNDPATDTSADGAAGILLYQPGTGVEIINNTLNANSFGIWTVAAPDVDIHDNSITGLAHTGNAYPTGIAIWSADMWTVDLGGSETATAATISNNTITTNDYGVLVRDYTAEGVAPAATVSGNTFNNNPTQVMATGDSVLAIATTLSGNTFDRAVTADHLGTLMPAIWGRIQLGIDTAAAGDTVNVAAGTYVEDPVITKAITLLGPNSTVNPNTGTRFAEAIVLPAYSAANYPNEAECETMVYLNESNITIKGFTFDGDNPDLTSGIMLGSADVDACEIIAGWDRMGSITVENNILRNATYAAIDLSNYTNPTVSSGNYIRNNRIEDIGVTTIPYGIGIITHYNFYADVTGNVLTGVRNGIQTGNHTVPNPGTTGSISNNTIGAWRLGIFHNMQYGTSSPLTISNNTITAESHSGATKWIGMLLSSIQGTSNATITNNTISIPGSVTFAPPGYTAGYSVWNTTTTAPLTIAGGSVTGGDYGVWVNNFEGYSSNSNNTAIILDGITINDSGIGIFVLDSPSNTNSATVSATLNDNIINGATIGVSIEGNDATASGYHNQIVGSGDDLTSTQPALLDFDENWWGSMGGPASITGNVDFTKWCGDAACTFLLPEDGGVITLGPGIVDMPGGIIANQPGLTFLILDGTTIQNTGLPCFEVNASNTIIKTESIGGAQCVPGGSSNGIDVAAGLSGIIVQGLEFVGNTGTDGIHFDGSIADVQIIDNWFHDFGGDGVQFITQPTGLINVQGNLFQNNAGNGIEAASFVIPAEFNSWGHINGAVAGDGASTNVDTNPFTHVDLYLTPMGVIPSEGSITYRVMGNFENVMGAVFTLQYPTSLLTVSGSPTNLSSFIAAGSNILEIDPVAGTISFNGMVDFGSEALSGTNLPIYEVTFTKVAGEGWLDLLEDSDEFSMAPTTVPAPSTNIFAAALVDSYVTSNSFNVTGTVSMQGRFERSGVPATLTGLIYGPYTAISANLPATGNLAFTGIVGDTYTFTTLQPRYLNITPDLSKAFLVSTDKVLPDLELKGGNATWRYDNIINIQDASLIGGEYRKTTFNEDADVNFDGKVNIGDLTLMGGNYRLTSASAYSTWLP